MFKRKRRRSHEFKQNSPQVISIEEAREERRRSRQAAKRGREAEPEEVYVEPPEKTSARKKAQSKRRRAICTAALLCFALLLSASIINILAMRAERAEVRRENAELLETKARLEQQLETVNTPEYIEEQARAHLRLVKPGEILYILPEQSSGEKESGDDE